MTIGLCLQMLLNVVCAKVQWIVCCRWIRAPADACFVQSVKHDKLNIGSLTWKRTSNSYNISSFWICSIKVDKCLRTYYKLSWKYVNKVEIISKVTITLSLINSNKDFDFVGWVIKTPCLYYFHGVKFHYVEETHDINSLLTLMKIILASQRKKQHRLRLESARAALCKWATRMASDLPFKNFCKLPKQAETIRNSAKKDFGYD